MSSALSYDKMNSIAEYSIHDWYCDLRIRQKNWPYQNILDGVGLTYYTPLPVYVLIAPISYICTVVLWRISSRSPPAPNYFGEHQAHTICS